MYTKRKRQEGMALLIAFVAIIVVLAAVSIVSIRVQIAKRSTDAAVDGVLLDEVCKAGVDYAIEKLWHQYVMTRGNTTANLASYRYYIDNVLVVPNNEDLNGNGYQDGNEMDSNGNGRFDIADPLVLFDPAREEDSFDVGNGDGVVDGLTITRCDDATGSDFAITATARVNDRRKAVVQTIRISGKPFTGYEYAVLANNMNCLLCHAGIRPLDLTYNTDPENYGTFDRIKVATLESLMFRTGQADSVVAGTVYSRGTVCNTDGHPMSASGLASSTVKTYEFDTTNGKLYQNPQTGNMQTRALLLAEVDDEGRPEQFANLYLNYPVDEELQTDGPLPANFPSPYPDEDGDRYVDDDEYERIASTLQGRLTGGIAYGIPEGGLYEGQGLPLESNEAAAALANSGRYNGNLVLVGTEDNPIVLDGDIAVDGDLMMKGKIKGWGQFFVKRNAYVVGDVTYADAENAYGMAEDGVENGMALTSGGSILIGDYLTIRGKSNTADLVKFPDVAGTIQCRDQHITRDMKYKGVTQTVDIGYFDPGVTDAGEIQDTMILPDGAEVPRQGQQFSFTTSELMLFNNLELKRALADPQYRPRFYGLRDTQPDKVYTYHNGADEHAVHYTETSGGVQLLIDYMISQGYDPNLLERASFHYMNPDQNWISEDTLRQIWWEDEMGRSRGDRYRFDGLMYSSNAIFAITRSQVRHNSNTEGKMTIRGALVCPDLGVLTPGSDAEGDESFTLLYDRRVKRFWSPEDTTQVTFRRGLYVPLAVLEKQA
ncbi:MAG TPA: hypothetical protein ENN80_12960 [Candidatus Hydrogenedentes bacterium]|nr:hypothetical protein [Candidatus Hydrogenedentota bacterium]